MARTDTDTEIDRSGEIRVAWSRRSMHSSDPPLASPGHLPIPQCVGNADKAIALIPEHHKKWRIDPER
jgi:hypothetical protein